VQLAGGFFYLCPKLIRMKILMVCLGNICRSPLAEGIMQQKINSYGLDAEVDSAGFEAFHTGDSPDERAIKVAFKNDIDISGYRARMFQLADFDRFDRIYVMDDNNFNDVMRKARNEHDRQKVGFILNELHPGSNDIVPDPYYGNSRDFEDVFDLLNEAIEKIAGELRKDG
jgi:protein-tyrosine phosphatase